MRTVDYKLTGKEVPVALQGTIIKIKVAENIADGVGKVWASEAAACEKANDGVVIAVQGLLRTASGKKDATAESLQAKADGYVYDVRAEGSGPRQPKPETIVNREAAATGVKNYERAIADPAWGQKAIKLGVFEQADLDRYVAAKDVAAKAAEMAKAVDQKQAATA